MAWPFDDDEVFMPVRDGGDPGGTQERVMLGAVGDLSGILRREDDNLDGTTTTLFTRRGRPVFETSTARSRASEVLYRGFVAKNPQTGYAVLFDPYTLTILRTSFSPAKPTYYVQDFATTWGVPPADTTNWYDVALFDGTSVKINAKAMPTLQVVANHSFAAIPYIIERSDPANRYGGPDQNNTEKRVFAVGRADVKEWGSGSVGSVQTLTPTTPRTDGKALTIGQRIDDTSDTAWLGQIYYTGAAWDSSGGGWYFTSAEVQMLLTSAYLVKVAGNANVDMSVPSFGAPAASSGSITTNVTLPPTEVGMYSTPTQTRATPFSKRYDFYDPEVPNPSGGLYEGYFNYSGTVERTLQGEKVGSFTRTTYASSATSSLQVAGRSFNFALSNSKNFDSRTTTTNIKAQTVFFDANIEGVDGTRGSNMTGNSTNLYWGQYFTTPPTGGLNDRMPGPTGGKTSRGVDSSGISGTNETRSFEEQTISASISDGAVTIVNLSAFRSYSYGQLAIYTPFTGYYSGFIGNPWYPVSYGMGVYGLASWRIEPYADPSTDEIWIYYYESTVQNISGWGNWYKQTQTTQDKINAKYQQLHTAILAQTARFDDESSSGYTSRTFYYGSVSPSAVQNSRSLTWQTRDFILFDEDNGVYISIEGVFSASGHPAAGTLTVTAKVETRYHTTTIQLGQWNYTYTELLPEREIGTTGKYAVPSPQIRAIFAPLYQEQGSFHGAHYVTADEESNGADPFHGFNFLLRLGTYGDFSTCNENNAENKDVYFVPCNLLEMLYAFVFSTEMGVAESGDRYPVTYASRYTQLVNELFIAHRISVSDGVQANWTDQLGPQFSSISNTTLHRV